MKIFFASLLLLLAPMLVAANTGQILYVSGQVTVERAGKLYRAAKNSKVMEGDVIDTGSIGRLHLRMSDRTLVSLKPNTQFKIETYRYEPASSSATPRSSSDVAIAPVANRSIFGLVKGGFRAITGLIGKADKSAFGVTTAVATIGIRGTAFTADFNGDGSSTQTAYLPQGIELASAHLDEWGDKDGTVSDADLLWLAQAGGSGTGGSALANRLTVGVEFGSVILSNGAGSLILENGEFGSVDDAATLPRRLIRPIADSELGGDDEDADTQTFDDDETQTQIATRMVTTRQDGLGSAFPGGVQQEESPPLVVEDTEFGELFGARRNLAVVSALSAQDQHTQSLTATESSLLTNARGDVVQFIGGIDTPSGQTIPALYNLDDGNVANQGGEPASGLQWGRWAGSITVVDTSGREQTFSGADLQLHLIQSVSRENNIVVPLTGSRDFALIGNTDPTSTSGVSGFLGQASLNANFDTQTVASSLTIGMPEQVWTASGTGSLGAGLAANAPSNVFAGQYNAVQVNGTTGGSGEFSGFLTNLANGAGMSYQLNSANESVSGVAAFAATAP